MRAGTDGSPVYVLSTNLVGTMNALEFARKRGGGILFLSTSRVYSIGPLRAIALTEGATRFEIADEQTQPGISPAGISEQFTTGQACSLYGATKLASELLIQEYAITYGLRAVINRCGVLAGPGQFGKVHQGVFRLWVANHFFGKPLKYMGFGGVGKQVRDLLHPSDLFTLLKRQIDSIHTWDASIYNVGGGRAVFTSLIELTRLCQEATGREIPMGSDPTTLAVDIPPYISDCRRVRDAYGWEPTRTVHDIVTEIAAWLRENDAMLRPLLAP